MRRIKIASLLGALMMLATSGLASAQAYHVPIITSITYQNVGTATANVQFQFYNETSPTPVTVSRQIPANAGDSLFVGGLQNNEALPAAFKGSAVMSADQQVVATLVQIPQSDLVKNRSLSNGFSSASSTVLLATVLKNKFHFSSIFSIQNAETNSAVDITVSLADADNPSAQPIEVKANNVPVGSAKYFDMGELPEIAAASFNGSATVTAVRTGGSTPANIVGSSIEEQLDGVGIYAFEGVQGGSTKISVATALCDIFAFKARTSYAVQNVDPTNDANVTVTYSGINNTTKDPVTKTAQHTITPGAKFSFIACDSGVGADFTGAATITSNVPIVAIAKAFGTGFSTAWLGEAQGTDTLALPYVRYSGDPEFVAGKYQRAFLAVQNVGTSAASGVVIEYRDKTGAILGTHALDPIAVGAKGNSTSIAATPAAGVDPNKLLYFGNPEANPGGGFGGAAIIKGPAGSQLIAIVRVQTSTGGSSVSEDANALALP
jgi:hypothetical protein